MDNTFKIYKDFDIINDPISSFLRCSLVGDYYNPPVDYGVLTESIKMNAHHESALEAKTNILSSCFKPTKFLDTNEFQKFISDYFVFGNAYFVPVRNKLGGVMQFDHRMANNIRKKKDGSYIFRLNTEVGQDITEIKEIIHFKAYDPTQNIYGVPKYLGALLDIVLNHSATIFRYRYYKNGSHAGFILSINGEMTDDDLKAINDQLKNSKGVNNFSNMMIHMPKGDKNAVNLIPISEIATKDEFVNIKNVTRDDILAAHRMPPELLSIMPTNTGGFGNVKDRATVYYYNEMLPIINRLNGINTKLGMKIFDFTEYALIKSDSDK